MPHDPWVSVPSLPHSTRMRLPPRPYSTCSRFFLGSLSQATSRSTSQALAMASMMRYVHPSPRSIALDHGAMAPLRIDFLPSGITSSGSTSCRVPRPLHELHIPSGELNEKLCGDSSGNDCPQHVR